VSRFIQFCTCKYQLYASTSVLKYLHK
jgi:hypothetical protein